MVYRSQHSSSLATLVPQSQNNCLPTMLESSLFGQLVKHQAPHLRFWWLKEEIARLHWPRVSVDWEADVDASNQGGHDVAHVDCLGVVALWKVKVWVWNDLLPSEAHVCAEDQDGAHVEPAPAEGLEDLKLKTVDVAYIDRVLKLAVWLPEEIDWVTWIED